MPVSALGMDRRTATPLTKRMTFRTAVLLLATLAMGLSAGLFFTFSIAVMPGLARTDDRTYVTAMRWINIKILNSWFAFAFGGAMLFTLVAAGAYLGGDGRGVLVWIVAAALLYAAQLVITFTVNVPLNNALLRATEGEVADPAAVRQRFEARWVRWNAVRSVLSVAAFACLLAAVVLDARAA
jgi:uncharacterized membrane protein